METINLVGVFKSNNVRKRMVVYDYNINPTLRRQ